MRKTVMALAIVGLLIAVTGCAKDVVEGSVQVTSTDPFKKLKGNTPRPPVMPQK